MNRMFDPVVSGCRRGDNVWFFDRYMTVGPPTIYAELLASAKSLVAIWDPWFNEPDHAILGSVRDGVTVTLLFAASSHADVRAKFNQRIELAQRSYPRLALRARYCCTDEGRGFHDRFLLLDRTRVFAVGASLSYHYQDMGSTSLVELASASDQLLLVQLHDEYWARGKTL